MGKSYWKQPISTEIFERDEFDSFDRGVWFEIIGRCRNEDGAIKPFWHGNKKIRLVLKKGQMLFRVSQYAKEQQVDRKRVRKSIDLLSKWYHEMDSEAKPYGLIVSLKNYDDLIKMDNEKDNERTMKGQRKNNERTNNNKSDKNDKNEKIEYIDAPEKLFDDKKLDEKTRKGEPLRIVGENKLVKLTDTEFKRLAQNYGHRNVKTYIKQLDFYMEGYGTKNKYKNHYAVLQNWLHRDTQSGKLQLSYYDFLESDFPSKEAYEAKTNKLPMI